MSSGPDNVELSGLAAVLRAEEPGSPEREAKVAALAKAVAAGTYSVDSGTLSETLIDSGFDWHVSEK